MGDSTKSAEPTTTFDSVVLAAVLAECRDLAGAGVRRVLPLAAGEVALVLRARRGPRTLLLSAHPRWTRMHLIREGQPGEATAFGRLLRSRLEGATLVSLDAPPFERLVTLTFETLEGPQRLLAELMGRHANLLLCEGGAIVGAARMVGADRARGRAVLPQHPYVPPAPPRTTPLSVTAADLLTAPVPAWRAVLGATGGIGPALAWEACLRAEVPATARMDEHSAGRVVEALRGFGAAVATGDFHPVLYRDDAGDPAAYAAWPLRAFERWRADPVGMSAAVDAYTSWASTAASLDALREGLATAISQAASRTGRALTAADEDARAAADADRLREQGELILAYLPRIGRSHEVLDVPGFDGAPVRIALDPHLSGVENAQAYFRRYARAAAAGKRLPARRAELEAERAFLESTATALAQAESADDLWEVEQDLIAAGLRRPARATARPKPVDHGRVFALPDGRVAHVGRSARENEKLTFDVAGPDDLWLHARGMPGAHVILSGRGHPSPAALQAAASLAAYYSAGRQAAKVPVDVTQRKHVRKIRGGRPGQVTYTHERTLMVSPALPTGMRRGPHT